MQSLFCHDESFETEKGGCYFTMWISNTLCEANWIIPGACVGFGWALGLNKDIFMADIDAWGESCNYKIFVSR